MGYLVIVRRDEPELFAYLQAHFTEPDVTVLLDRRRGERRRGRDPGVAGERRRQERRAPAPADDPLWQFGFRVAVARD